MGSPLLRRGDRLPSVVAVQLLLNRCGFSVSVDGIFGPRTERAVKEFQGWRRLKTDGIVGPKTWKALNYGIGLQVMDCVDNTDLDLTDDLENLRNAGGSPIVSFGACGGAPLVVKEVLRRARRNSVAILRFHGHGSPGVMVLTGGRGSGHFTSINVDYIDSIVNFLIRNDIKSIFPPFGSVELHGCRVARGPDGLRLLQGLAYACGVPVTAGIGYQYGGYPMSAVLRFEGRIRTVFPKNVSLKTWAKKAEAASGLASLGGVYCGISG